MPAAAEQLPAVHTGQQLIVLTSMCRLMTNLGDILAAKEYVDFVL